MSRAFSPQPCECRPIARIVVQAYYSRQGWWKLVRCESCGRQWTDIYELEASDV